MRRLAAALILVPLLGGPALAESRPFALPALSDAELEAQSARGPHQDVQATLTLRFAADSDPVAPAGRDPAMPPGFFGIQNLVLESGTTSVSRAMTSIALTATLKN